MATTTTDNRRKLDAILRETAKLSRTTVTVGVHGDAGQHADSPDTVATIAAKNEFGDGRIPERSFLRSTFDVNRAKLLETMRESAELVMSGQATAQKAGTRIGVVAVGEVKKTILDGIDPPLSQMTLALRAEKAAHGGGLASLAGATTPLIDTGQLINSITFRVDGAT